MNNQVFVGTKTVNLLEFQELLKHEFIKTDKTYYFLNWVDKVEGFLPGVPEQLAPEGQIFTPQLELRWRKQGDDYNLLLLSRIGNFGNCQPIKKDWQWKHETRNAHTYPRTETRFPRTIKANNLKIKQHYFINKQTSTIHFVALTIEKKDDK